MEKMTGKSMDLVAENIAQMKMLFPEAVTEGKIDFEVLKALLGGEIEQRQEYYKFTWNGKEAARAYARTRSMGTLRPCEAESSGKDGTPGKFDSDNLYIEGDNLEVLKLLQGPYHKRVKMIYIDPPYNTGHDFVYPDNFKDSIGNYKALTGQTDDEGKSTRANPETSGRYHTDWLNMMYSRLILARNLLTEDGVIFISIDDNEVTNLRKICDDIFGEDCFIATLIWKRRASSAMSEHNVSVDHDYVLAYSKGNTGFFKGKENDYSAYSNPDNDPRGPWVLGDLTVGMTAAMRPNQAYDLIDPKTGKKYPFNPNRVWSYIPESMNKLIEEERIYFPTDTSKRPMKKRFQYELKETSSPISTLLLDQVGLNSEATRALQKIFDGNIFDFSKPLSLLTVLCQQMTKDNDIILDFFAGSSTSAHSVIQLNAEDGGTRKFIMVQLPEICKSDSSAAQAGYVNICEIGKERIRRAAKKIKGEHPDWNGDMGFKVFKLDTSNLLPWNPNADELEQNLFAAVDNVLEGRSTDDLLYEILLKCNLPLTLPIEEKKFGANTVYVVGAGALAICLDGKIPQTIAEEIVKLRDEYAPIVPMQVVFRDNGFTDVAKTNALQILKQAGFEEKSIQTI